MNALLLAGVLLVAVPPNDAVTVNAKLPADTLEVGKTYTFDVSVAVNPGWSIDDATVGQKVMKPILQIDAPPGITLAGDAPADARALAKNEFLQAPYELLVTHDPEQIAFTLNAAPAADQPIRFNVLTYVSADPKQNAYLIRRRFELPLSPNAEAKQIDPVPSDWGKGDELQLGQAAPNFELPRLTDDSMLKLSDYIGKKIVIVTTYRAFW